MGSDSEVAYFGITRWQAQRLESEQLVDLLQLLDDRVSKTLPEASVRRALGAYCVLDSRAIENLSRYDEDGKVRESFRVFFAPGVIDDAHLLAGVGDALATAVAIEDAG